MNPKGTPPCVCVRARARAHTPSPPLPPPPARAPRVLNWMLVYTLLPGPQGVRCFPGLICEGVRVGVLAEIPLSRDPLRRGRTSAWSAESGDYLRAREDRPLAEPGPAPSPGPGPALLIRSRPSPPGPAGAGPAPRSQHAVRQRRCGGRSREVG